MKLKFNVSQIYIAILLLVPAISNATIATDVDFASVVTDVATVGSAIVAVLVAIKGAQYILGMVRRG